MGTTPRGVPDPGQREPRATQIPHGSGLPDKLQGGVFAVKTSAAVHDARSSVVCRRTAPGGLQSDGSPGCGTMVQIRTAPTEERRMSKRARKRRSRKGNAANHGKKPNA